MLTLLESPRLREDAEAGAGNGHQSAAHRNGSNGERPSGAVRITRQLRQLQEVRP